jgi:hypothetical protein
MEQKTVKISDVLAMLKSGFTRYNNNPGYNPEIGSIKDYYNLTTGEAKLLFAHPKLQKVRTTVKASLIIEDDLEENAQNTVVVDEYVAPETSMEDTTGCVTEGDNRQIKETADMSSEEEFSNLF